MSKSIEINKDKIRVEFKDFKDKNPGAWTVLFSFNRKIIFGGQELNVWSHWFSLPTKINLNVSTDCVKKCGERFLSTLELHKQHLPKEEKDFGPQAILNVHPILMNELNSIANTQI